MGFIPEEFVNREAEIDAFVGLLSDRRQRILLVHGQPGIGKTSVLYRLRRMCRDRQTVSALVDFRSDRALSRSDRVIGRLREQIGGDFSAELGQTEAHIQRDFGMLAADATQGRAGFTVGAFVPADRGAGGGVSLAGQVEVGGDVVGRDKITIKNSTLVFSPEAALSLASAEIETRRNAAFRSALCGLVAQQRLVLFLDHLDEATEDVTGWLRACVLGLHLEEVDDFSNLWIVVAGRRLPFQEEIDRWRRVIRTQMIGPLSDDAIVMFWVDKRGLDPAQVPVIIPASAGNPQFLFWMANNVAERRGRGQIGGYGSAIQL